MARRGGRRQRRRGRLARLRLTSDIKEELMCVLEISNKVVETLITLLCIYLLTELNRVPTGCRLYSCLDKWVENGGTVEPDFFLRPCSEQRQLCAFSYANPQHLRPGHKVTHNLTDATLEMFKGMRVYCECLLQTNINDDTTDDIPIFCETTEARMVFFGFGILLVAYMEATTTVRGFRHHYLRLYGLFMIIVLYMSVSIFYAAAQDSCDSFELHISLLVVHSVTISSCAVSLVVGAFEFYCWRRAFRRVAALDEKSE
eukprot:m.6238 g.6238  ORF g.6238 m.6238 type:complete len:258 (+) comp5139_c0_seq2:1843-2616(+)